MKKWLLISGIIFIVLILGGIIGLNLYIGSFEDAQLRYTNQLTFSQLDSPVNIKFDQYAIPHIEAQNDHDLYFASGYIIASERMWQMEVARLAGQGRLAELIGPEAVEYDKFIRTIGFHRLADQLRDYIEDETLEKLQAYTDGVNAYLDRVGDNLPVEYSLLDFQPESWTVEHSLSIIRLIGWELNVSWHVDLVLGALTDELGQKKAGEIFPNYPEDAPQIISSGEGRFASRMLPVLDLDIELRSFLGSPGSHVGSNSWVISGGLSSSGEPILANDPHLGFTQPSKWYEIHLKAPEIDVAGVSLAGVPGVVIGHNQSIAWGLTSVMADDADFFLERVDPNNPFLYFYEGQWTGMEHRVERIKVKGQGVDSITVRETHRGPIISDIHPLGNYDSERVVSMQWTGHEMSDEMTAIDGINRAGTWEEFSQAVGQFHVPGQNFIYADSLGNIGYRAGVKLPVRRSGRGRIPVPGDVNNYDWTGFMGPLDLPYIYNPPDGYIATANNKMIDDSPYQYTVSNLYEPPSRIQRIQELLEAKNSHSVEDVKRYQMDYVSPHARSVALYFVQAFQDAEIEDRYVREAVEWLERWDYTMSTESIPATIFNVAFNRLIHNLYKDEMGDTLLYHYVKVPNVPIRNISYLLEHPLNLWWDNVLTEGFESRDVTLRKSLVDAVKWLRENHGRSMVNWQWGMLHKVTFPHMVGRESRIAEILINFNVGPFEVGGTGMTLNNGEYSFQAPYENILGPSTRQIVDFSDLDNSISVIYSGQSGHPSSKHYDDQTPLWLKGDYHTLPLSEAVIDSITKYTLFMRPE